MGGKTLSIAIVGAGIGGLTSATTLRCAGFDVRIYEQATRFARVGAGIQMMPNSMKVLRRIGVEERVRSIAFQPYSHLNREWDTGKVMRDHSSSSGTAWAGPAGWAGDARLCGRHARPRGHRSRRRRRPFSGARDHHRP